MDTTPPPQRSSSVSEPSAVTTFLFTDIEGSTRLWEREPERMVHALACHDALARAGVVAHGGTVVKTTGDGLHAAFDDPLAALNAAVQLQQALADPAATHGIALAVRCGLHAGVDARRDGDFYGTAVNRAARIMAAAHGGQVLVSHAVAALVADRLPAGVSLRDLGSVRLRDLARPERVFQLVHPQLRAQFPALRSLEATPNNLPAQLTSFVGRERELVEVRDALRATRLLTLVGGGGLGKTRLSLQAAAEVADDFPDGVWLTELAPVGDPARVPQAIASVLGVKEAPGLATIDALAKFVRDRRLLLVLDNCEHLVRACAECAKRLLDAGPGVTILASSREALNVGGERTYAVAPLPIPTPGDRRGLDAIAGYAAVQLFAERAAAAQPWFRVGDDNAEAVAEVCRRLDGIPLALELAAARLRSLPVERIAERLSDRFRLLTGGDRTALPRQQTLRALIDWSHDLLDERERALFGRLAVFAGGFTLEAAESVGAGGAIAVADVLDLLARLVEKSLVMLDAGGERYRMLETVRQYAEERLAAAEDEMRAARSRHLGYCVALAETARPMLYGPDQAAWLRRLDAERENLLAAHAWCDHDADGAQRDLRLVVATKPYWLNRGLVRLARGITVQALARPGARARDRARSTVLFDLGQYDFATGDYASARQCLEESVAIARELGDRGRVGAALQPLGMVLLEQGDHAAARGCLVEALAYSRESGNLREVAAALTALAHVDRMEGVIDAAEAHYAEALALVRGLGDTASIAITLLNLAMVSIARGRPEGAGGMLVEAAAIVAETGSRRIGQSVLDIAAGLAAARGRWERAARLFGAADALALQMAIPREPADEAFLLPLRIATRAALAPAALAAAESAGGALDYGDAMAELRDWLGRDR